MRKQARLLLCGPALAALAALPGCLGEPPMGASAGGSGGAAGPGGASGGVACKVVEDGAWTPIASGGPGPRYGAAMAADPGDGSVLLVGGATAVGEDSAEAWRWTGESWGPLPSASRTRWGSVMAHDDARGTFVVFGGGASGPLMVVQPDDTEIFDGTSWSVACGASVGVPCGPAGRTQASMAYHAARGRVLLVGGNPSAGGHFGDAWEWDGKAWSAVCGAAGRDACPFEARGSAGIAYDRAREVIVLFGGHRAPGGVSDETWEYGASGAWKLVAPGPSTQAPPARSDMVMVHDEQRHVTVVFEGIGVAGADLTDTWSWDGACWTRSQVSPPAPLRYRAGAYDGVTGRMLVHGGIDPGSSGEVFSTLLGYR
jgi:hypothetical protein